jgi:DNA-binding MarR family transcriptional regulator
MQDDDAAVPRTGRDVASALQLVTDIQRATHVLGLRLESALSDLSVSQGEIHVLSLLARSGSASVADLQTGVRHRPSTLTGIVDRLAAKNLVTRRINEADRRSNLIELTPEGRVAVDRVLAAMSDVERSLKKDSSTSDLEVFRRILHRIATDL